MNNFMLHPIFILLLGALLSYTSAIPISNHLRPPIDGTSDLTKRGTITTCNVWNSTNSSLVEDNTVAWMPIADTSPKQLGYESAVKNVCSIASGDGPLTFGSEFWTAGSVSLGPGENIMLSDGMFGVLTLSIDSKSDKSDFKVDFQRCQDNLMKFADPNSACYGPGRKDTIGGTFLDDNGIAYLVRPEYDPSISQRKL